MTQRELAVRARALVKRYGEFTAVAGVDFSIERGECFGFLGPNGAGKTSTMRMLQALAVPTSGELRVLGRDPVSQGKQLRARLGVCAQEDNLDPELHVRENLTVYGSYYPIERRVIAERADQLLAFLQLEVKRDQPIPELSGGMKRRLMIARALINDPELVILDEPTTGLDPQARHLIWGKLRELKQRGVTMLLTTHYMDEAERLCDRLVIMDGGKILDTGSPRALIEKHVGQEAVELRLEHADEAEVLAELDLSSVASERVGDARTFFFPKRTPLIERLLERARQHGVTCLVRNATLEDVFLKLAGRELLE